VSIHFIGIMRCEESEWDWEATSCRCKRLRSRFRSLGDVLVQAFQIPSFLRQFCGEIREAGDMGRSKEPKSRQIEEKPSSVCGEQRMGENT